MVNAFAGDDNEILSNHTAPITDMHEYAAFHSQCISNAQKDQRGSSWLDSAFGAYHSLVSFLRSFTTERHPNEALLAKAHAAKTHAYYKTQAALTAQNLELSRLQQRHHRHFAPSPITREAQIVEMSPRAEVSLPPGARAIPTATRRRVTIAMYGSLVLNVFLLLVKLVAVYLSRSLTVIASVLDSVLDIFSGLFLLVLNTVVRRMDARKYPIGTKRIAPLGVLIFSSIMASASLSVVQHCVSSLYEHLTSSDEGIAHSLTVVIIMEIVVVVKCAMYLYCRTLASGDVICDALIRDHRNDVLSNTAGLAGVALTLLMHVIWDDIIGISITMYIIVNWSMAAYEQMRALSCKTAPLSVVNQIVFVALNHHRAVTAIEKVKVYSVGCGYHAEVDIVLPPEMTLQRAHDIGESLQVFLETQEVQPIARAYVHVDYETNHHTHEHR